jgi:hypothetical protein
MKLINKSQYLLSALFGGFCAFTLGCVISVGPGDDSGSEKKCGDLLTNSFEQGGTCFCKAGYDWCNANDPDDYTCCEEKDKPGSACDQPNNVIVNEQCVCDVGFNWCNPDDLADYSCCEDGGAGTTTGGTTTEGTSEGTSEGTTAGSESESDGGTGDPGCASAYEVPASCDEVNEPFFCTHPDTCTPEGSKYYVCQGGVYVEQTQATGDAGCVSDGYDFYAGCLDTNSGIDIFCGVGPGTPCTTGSADSCEANGDELLTCTYGKLSAKSCLYECMVEGDRRGVTYDYGECGEQGGAIQCLCCDFDEEGCGPEDTN